LRKDSREGARVSLRDEPSGEKPRQNRKPTRNFKTKEKPIEKKFAMAPQKTEHAHKRRSRTT